MPAKKISEFSEDTSPARTDPILLEDVNTGAFKYTSFRYLSKILGSSLNTREFVGYTSSAADPTATEYGSGTWGFHENTDSGVFFFVYNDGGTILAAEIPVLSSGRNASTLVIALGDAETAGGVFTWQNTLGVGIVVLRMVIRLTTISTDPCTIDVGYDVAVASDDSLIDGLDVNAGTGIFDNISDPGVNGQALQWVADNEYITGSKATGAAAGLTGFAYIHYIKV